MGIARAIMGILSKKEDVKVDTPNIVKLKRFMFPSARFSNLEDTISIRPFSFKVPAKTFNPIRKKIIFQSI
jgi:hypothetical protein